MTLLSPGRAGMKMQGTTSQSASPQSLSGDGTTASPGNYFQICEGKEGVRSHEHELTQRQVMFDQPDDFLQLSVCLGRGGESSESPLNLHRETKNYGLDEVGVR